MDITIVMLSGVSHTLRVNPDDTVGNLKMLIHKQLGEPPHNQRLVFVNGQRIDLSNDSQTIRSYGLQSGSRVSLLVTEPPTTQVLLRNDKGRTSTYDVTPEESVDDFKRRVECRERVPVSQQRLLFQSREMMSGRLADYGVQMNSTIDLALRLRGG